MAENQYPGVDLDFCFGVVVGSDGGFGYGVLGSALQFHWVISSHSNSMG
jgi:hypothetical protein